MGRPDSVLQRGGLILATGFGSGYSSFAPGTAGTLAVLPVHGLLALWLTPLQIAIVAVLFIPVAISAAGVGARVFELKDPPPVVVDEWAGYLITVAALPTGWPLFVGGFFLFRLFDIFKPPPARQLEALPGGYGIVLDDVMAGVYAHLVLRAIFFLFPGIL